MTPWTVALQAPLSMEFSKQEYWSGLPFPSPGDLPNPGIESRSPTLQADSLLTEPPGNPLNALGVPLNSLGALKHISNSHSPDRNYHQSTCTSLRKTSVSLSASEFFIPTNTIPNPEDAGHIQACQVILPSVLSLLLISYQ